MVSDNSIDFHQASIHSQRPGWLQKVETRRFCEYNRLGDANGNVPGQACDLQLHGGVDET